MLQKSDARARARPRKPCEIADLSEVVLLAVNSEAYICPHLAGVGNAITTHVYGIQIRLKVLTGIARISAMMHKISPCFPLAPFSFAA